MKTPRKRLAENIIYLVVLQGANYILPLISLPYLVRVLGPEKFGLIVFAQAFVQYFVVLTDYGFNFSATREISIHRNDVNKVSEIFWAVFAIKTVLMLLGFLVLVSIVVTVPMLRGEWVLYVVAYIAVVGSAISPIWYFQGIEKMKYVTILNVASRTIMVACILIFVQTKNDYLLAAALQAGSILVSGGLGLYLSWKMTSLSFALPSRHRVATTLAEGWSVFLSSASIGLYTNSNVFLLGLFTNPTTVGYFAAAEKLVKAFSALFSPIAQAVYPYVAAMGQESKANTYLFLRKVRAVLGGVGLSVSFVLVVGAPFLTQLLYGDGYERSAQLLAIMSPIPLFLSLAICYATLFMLALGYKAQWSQIIVRTLYVNFGSLFALYFFIPFDYAVAITFVLSELWVLAMSYLFWRAQSGSWKLS